MLAELYMTPAQRNQAKEILSIPDFWLEVNWFKMDRNTLVGHGTFRCRTCGKIDQEHELLVDPEGKMRYGQGAWALCSCA